MIAKIKCPHCGKIHDLEPKIDLEKLLEECSTDGEWTNLVFKCLVFPKTHELQDGNELVKDAKRALKEMERMFLNMIIDYEETYGVTVQYIETNLTGIPNHERTNELRTNSILVYGDL